MAHDEDPPGLALLDKQPNASDIHFCRQHTVGRVDRAKANDLVEQLRELAHALEKRIAFPAANLPLIPGHMPPSAAARYVRDTWDVPTRPVAHLGAILESRGIVIHLAKTTDYSTERTGTYSATADGRPFLIVAPEHTQSVYQYRYACAHELGHLVLHTNSRLDNLRHEREADEFATELLAPWTLIRPLLCRQDLESALRQAQTQWGIPAGRLIARLRGPDSAPTETIDALRNRNTDPDQSVCRYAGETPSLLREAADHAARHGFTRSNLASELCRPLALIRELLGEADSRPRLALVPAHN